MTAEQQFSGRERNRIIVAASAGNFAEWFDWGVYGGRHHPRNQVLSERLPPGEVSSRTSSTRHTNDSGFGSACQFMC